MSYVLTQSRIGPKQPQSVTGPSSLVLPYRPQRLVNFAVGEHDQITGSLLTRVGSGAFTSVVTEKGVGLRFGAANGSTYLSAAVRGERTNTTAAQISHLWVGSVPSSTYGIGVRDWTPNSGTIPVWRDADKYRARLGAATIAEVGTWNSAFVNAQCLSSFDAGAGAFAVDGEVLSTTSFSHTASIISPWVLHRNGDNAQGQECTTLLWGVFARAFPQELVQYLSKNPWAAFASSIGLRVFLPTAAAATLVTVSVSGALRSRGTAEATTIRYGSCVSAAAIKGAAGATTLRVAQLASTATARGIAEIASIRAEFAAGYVAARGATSATPVSAGVITAVASGQIAARALCVATSIRSIALTSTATARGVAESTSIRTGLAAGRVGARGTIDAAAVAPGVNLASVSGRTYALGSSASTTTRAASLSSAVAASGVTSASSLRDGLATGRITARGVVTISTGGAFTPAASRTWLVPFEDRTLYVYQDNQ